MSPLPPLLRGSGACVAVTGHGGLPFQFLCGSWGSHFSFFFSIFFFFFSLSFLLLLFIYIHRVPA